MRFEDAYKEYLKYVAIKQKIQSKGILEQRFKNRILPFFKDFDIYSIKEIDYLNWQDEIEKHNYSDNYKKNLHYLISGFFEYCILFYGLNTNIAKKVGCFKLKNVKTKHDFYTLKEFKKFIKCFDNDIYRQFFNLMFFTGTRPGEAMALRFSDLSYCSISINKTISEHSYNGQRVVVDPKSICSFRSISIDKKLYNSLIDLKKFYIKKYNDLDFDYYIFGGKKPLSPTSINRHKIKACSLANIRPIKLHEFRHSHASLLNSLSISVNDIKDRLGHEDVKITSSVYIHSTDKNKKRITRILNLLRLVI